MVNGRPGGTGFTNSATVSDAAVFPHVDPTAPAGQKDRDITWAQMVALLGDIDVPQTATPFLITGDGTTTAWPITYDVGAYPVHEAIEVATKRHLIEDTHFYVEITATGAVVHIDRTGQSAGTVTPLGNGAQVAVFVTRVGANAALPTTFLFGITGYTATPPTGAPVESPTYADLAAFEAAVEPSDDFQACRLIGWPTPSGLVGLESRWNGTNYEWGTI